jgi:hypothetical protein
MTNIYKLDRLTKVGHDIYTGAIVAADTEDEARHIHPNRRIANGWHTRDERLWDAYFSWVKPSEVKVEYIGTTEQPKGCILASFKAG